MPCIWQEVFEMPKRNYFAAVCNSQKSVHLMHNDDSDQSAAEGPDHFIGDVNSKVAMKLL